MRYIIVDIKESKEKDTNENILFVTGYKLATKYKDALWHHKKEDALICFPIKEKENPIEYQNFKTYLPGALFDCEYGVNSITGKIKLVKREYVKNSNKHFRDDVYLG